MTRIERQIESLDAGSLIDWLVQSACNIEWDQRFVPSVDWNHAMIAADQFGLWQQCRMGGFGETMTVDKKPSMMAIFRFEASGYWGSVSHADTGQLAICRAILKLHYLESYT